MHSMNWSISSTQRRAQRMLPSLCHSSETGFRPCPTPSLDLNDATLHSWKPSSICLGLLWARGSSKLTHLSSVCWSAHAPSIFHSCSARLRTVSPTVRTSFRRLDILSDGHSESGLQALDSRLPSTSTSPLTRRVVYDRIHYLLQHIYALIPTLPSTLHPLLVRSFPHKRQSQAAQITYIRNILKVTEYCPELAEAVLGTIVDRAIQIDVRLHSLLLVARV